MRGSYLNSRFTSLVYEARKNIITSLVSTRLVYEARKIQVTRLVQTQSKYEPRIRPGPRIRAVYEARTSSSDARPRAVFSFEFTTAYRILITVTYILLYG